MNVKLLRKVKRHILEEPKRLDMNTLGEKSSAAPCGTAACIAGWTHMLSKPQAIVSYNVHGKLLIDGKANHWSMAIPLLDLTAHQRDRLCREPRFSLGTSATYYTNKWPERFAAKYVKAKTARQRAKVTAARIEYFIKTKGAE